MMDLIRVVLGMKSTLFNLFLNLFIRFFWHLKVGKKMVLDFQRKFLLLCPKSGKRVIFGPEINISELFSKSIH